MSDKTAAQKPSLLSSSLKSVDEAREKLEKLRHDVMASNDAAGGASKESFMSIRSGSALKTLRISSSQHAASNSSHPKDQDHQNEGASLFEVESEPVLMLSPSNKKPFRRKTSSIVFHVGAVLVTSIWFGLCASYITTDIGWGNLTAQKPHLLGGFIAGMMAPVALLWMMLAFLQRGSDIQMYAESLRGELQSMIFPSEERSGVIHKDIEELVRQAAELATASKAVLKSIHRARMGLRAEIQGMAGLSRKTEFHIGRLSETLNERSVKLLSLTEEIESRTSVIGDKSQDGIKAWDKATMAVIARSGEMESALAKGAEKLLTAADSAKAKTDGISDTLDLTYQGLRTTIDDIAARLSALSGEFEQHKDDLSGVAKSVADETGKLGDALSGQMRELENMTARTVEKIDIAGGRIFESRDALSEGAQKLSGEADAIASRFDTSVSSMQAAAGEISSKTLEVEARLGARAQTLGDILGSIESQTQSIDTVASEAANKLSQSMGLALSGAESIGGAVRRAVESLSRATEEAQDKAENLIVKTKDNVEALNNAGAGNVEHVQNIVSLLERSRSQIEAATGLAGTQISKLSETVDEQVGKINIAQATLTERIESVREALSQPLQAVTRAVSDADAKHEAIASTLTRRVKDLTDASDRATENAEKIRDLLRNQAQDISVLSGQIAGHSRSISEHMGSQKDDLSKKVSSSLAEIESVRAALEEQAGRLAGLTHSAQNDIATLNTAIEQSSTGISRTSQSALSDLSRLDVSLAARVNVLKDESASAINSFEAIAHSIRKTAEDIEPIHMKAVERADQAHERLEVLRSGFDTTVNTGLGKLGELGSSFDERLGKLQDGVARATHLLKSSSEELQNRAEDIESAATSAGDKMRAIEGALNNQASDIHLASDHALLKIETVQKAIDDQFHDFSTSVAKAVAHIKDAGEEFSTQAQRAETASEMATSRFSQAGDIAAAEAQRLKEAGADTVNHGRDLVSQVQKEAAALLATTKESLGELRKTSDNFAFRATEIAQQMHASLSTSKEYGQELEGQAASVADAGRKAADIVGHAVSVLGAKLGNIDTAAVDITKRLDGSRVKLEQEAAILATASAKALTASSEASETFARQSAAMFKAAQEATRQIETIKDTEWKARREAFLSSAKFVVESLHSLSVDITRVADGGVQEKTWKAYQAGDVSAFTRRLADVESRIPVEKVREKYAGDSEFRNYVGRFMRQFEEVFDQASANDHGDLLGATFFSSDVGKLYQTLCVATGREPRRIQLPSSRKTA